MEGILPAAFLRYIRLTILNVLRYSTESEWEAERGTGYVWNVKTFWIIYDASYARAVYNSRDRKTHTTITGETNTDA